MSKNGTENFNWQNRAGSYSTHGSRKGVNNLNWGEPEKITPEIEKRSLIQRQNQIQKQITELPKSSSRRKALVAELNAIYLARGLQDHTKKSKTKKERAEIIRQNFIDVIREDVPKTTWNRWMNEAVRRYEFAEGSAYGCPLCKSFVYIKSITTKKAVCPECGQRLDWSEE